MCAVSCPHNGVVCAGELPSGPPALGSNPCIHMESVARDKPPAHYVGIVKLPYDLDVDAYPGAMQFSWGVDISVKCPFFQKSATKITLTAVACGNRDFYSQPPAA